MGGLDGLLLVIWLGVLAGFGEVLVLGIIKAGSLALPPEGWMGSYIRWRHGYLWLSPHVVWMAPVASVAQLAVPGILLTAFARLEPRLVSLKLAAGVLTFVAFTSLLLVYQRLYVIAVGLLAGGVAVQTARMVGAHAVGFRRVLRRTAPWLVAGVATLAMGMLATPAITERFRITRLPPAPDGAPNILLLILDTVRAPNLSLYGYARPTAPHLEELAADGVTFDMALATSSWTLPSHVSAFTGHLPYEVSADFLTPYEGENPTLAERLLQRGYVTAGFVANLLFCGYETGLNRGFVRYEDYRISAGEFLLSTAIGRRIAHSQVVRRLVDHHDLINRKRAGDVTGDFLRWVDGRSSDRPFFAFLNYYDAHEPYLPPAPYDERFGSAAPRRNHLNVHRPRDTVRPDRASMGPDELRAELDAYDGAIAFIDDQIGVLLEELRDREILDNTLVIVTSDHGEQFGEHGLHVHANSLYMPLLHVPLVMVFGDRLPAGVRVSTPVSIRDIPATVVGVVDGTDTREVPGESLARHWNGATEREDALAPPFAEHTDIRGAPTMKSIVVGPYHYIWGENRFEALFDLVTDSGELDNLVRPEHVELVTAMRREMAPHILNDRALLSRLPAGNRGPAQDQREP